MRHARRLATFAALVLACSSSNSADAPGGGDAGVEGGGDFTHDLVVSMQVTVKAFEELHLCQFVTLPADADVNVVRMSHRYTSGSHHFLVFETDLDAIPPDMQGQYDCTYGSEPVMQHSRGILYGAQSPNGTFPLPDGVGLPMKAHQVLMLQSHYLNPLSHELVATVSAGFDTAPADQIREKAGFLLFYDPFIYLPALSAATSGIRCQTPSTHAINLVTGFTHYHQRGTGMRVWVDPDASTKSDAPFFQTTDWEHPEDFHGPLTVPPNSVFRTQCDYQNTATVEVFQGPNAATSEMCVFAGIYYPKVSGDFETCQNLSVTDTGTKACFDVLTCVSACPGGDAPEFTPGGVNVGPCWERCLASSCPGATDLVVQMTTCVGEKCAAECGMGEDACNACATDKCAAELGPCLTHACPP